MNNKTVLVKVINKNGNKLPVKFPFTDWVRLNVLNDVTTVNGMMKEMKQIKEHVLVDIHKHKINFKDVDIKICWD